MRIRKIYAVDRQLVPVRRFHRQEPVAGAGLVGLPWAPARSRGNAADVLPNRDLGHGCLDPFARCDFHRVGPGWAVHPIIDDAIAVVVDFVAGLLAGEARNGVTDRVSVGRAHRDTLIGAGTDARRASLAQAEALVGAAIAVVVDVIAEFGAGNPFFCDDAGSCAVAVADHLSGAGTSTHPFEAIIAEAEALVDGAVAVVVDIIAEFGAWSPADGTAGGAFLVATTGDHPCLTTGSNTSKALLCQVEVLVGAAIAVVIVPITPFWCGRDDIVHNALGVSSVSASYDALASAHIVAEARHTDVEVLVGAAIAVVVDVVADLGAGGAGISYAYGEVFPLCAGEPAGAGADANPYLTSTVEVEVLVGAAIAVVVDVVADLCPGEGRDCIAAGAGKAVTDDLALALASADTRLTRTAETCVVLVGAAVAVVVDIVAGLGARCAGLGRTADSRAVICIADPLTLGSACADPDKTTGWARGEFVHPAVAVVVDVIADLCLRKGFPIASCPVALGVAGLRTCGTGTLSPGALGAAVAIPLLPWKAVAREPSDIVDGAVAVVVETVADLNIVGAAPAAVVAGGVLVDVAVAVVVLVIADLGDALRPLVHHAEVCRGQYLGVGGTRVLLTGINSALSLLIRSVAGIARISALAATIEGEALIDAAIVVVVQAVAELGVARIWFPAVCDGIVPPAITQASIGGGHIRGHRVGPAVAGASAVSGGAVAPTTSTTLATVSALLDADVGWEILDAATEAAYEDVEENEDGPRNSSAPGGDRGHGIGFGDSPPFWAVVIAVTSAHCVLVFSFYKPQK